MWVATICHHNVIKVLSANVAKLFDTLDGYLPNLWGVILLWLQIHFISWQITIICELILHLSFCDISDLFRNVTLSTFSTVHTPSINIIFLMMEVRDKKGYMIALNIKLAHESHVD